MTVTRENARPLRPVLGAAAVRTVLLSAVTAAVYWVVTTYSADAVAFLQKLGLRPREITPWVLPVSLVLVALPGWRSLASCVELIRVAIRYRTASSWERQLDDPQRAADVPPLGSHLIEGNGAGVPAAAATLAGSVAVTLGSVGFALADGRGMLPFPASEDAVGNAWLLAIGAAWAVLASTRALRTAMRRAKVERLSSSGPAEVSLGLTDQLATEIPTLTVRFDHALRPAPGRGSVGRILYLRLFDNRAGTDRFVSRWRTVGVVHYLRSADQVTAAELKTWSGRVGDLSVFVDNDAELDELLAATPPIEGPDGYPDGQLLCHGSYWRRAVTRLLGEVDSVVLDLTGFHAGHGGTAFEIRSAFDLVDVDRLKLTAALGSDRRFLTAQLQRAWSELAADSPNAGPGVRTITVHVG